MEILPRILDHGRLILLFNLSITDWMGFEYHNVGSSSGSSSKSDSKSESGESGSEEGSGEESSENTQLQLPTMQMRGFVQEIAMRSGQTLILTGFEQTQEDTSTTGVGKAKVGILGGTADNSTDRDTLVILVTPEVLQSPLAPEALMRDY